MPACSSTEQTLAHESARKRGAETWAAKGLSDARTVFRVMMAAEGVREGTAERAVFMSDAERGEPVIRVRPARGMRWLEGRMRAVAVWPRKSRVDKTCWPVRPVAPMRRKCIVFYVGGCC
jgi:hypothetical protein